MSFLSCVSLIFVVAKVFGVIDWNWFLVFMPFGIEILIATLKAILEISAKRVEERND